MQTLISRKTCDLDLINKTDVATRLPWHAAINNFIIVYSVLLLIVCPCILYRLLFLKSITVLLISVYSIDMNIVYLIDILIYQYKYIAALRVVLIVCLTRWGYDLHNVHIVVLRNGFLDCVGYCIVVSVFRVSFVGLVLEGQTAGLYIFSRRPRSETNCIIVIGRINENLRGSSGPHPIPRPPTSRPIVHSVVH